MTQDLSLAVDAIYDSPQVVKSEAPYNVLVAPNFVHLHLHTPWSLLDGFCRIDELIELAKSFGMKAIGVSEHGNCHSHIEFYTKCKAAGIKPVLGCEVYTTPHRTWKKAEFSYAPYKKKGYAYRTKGKMVEDGAEELPEQGDAPAGMKWSAIPTHAVSNLFKWRPKVGHLLLIAKDNAGYANLLKISSIAYLEGMYYKPRADYRLLKKYGKGIIATTACIGSEVNQFIRLGKLRVAKNLIRFFQSCFDELYLELQPSDLPEQKIVNEVLKAWSVEMNIPLVATSDAHMLRPEEKPIHKALTMIGKAEDDSDISVYEHCYFKTAQEMLDGGMPVEALENSWRIAQKCTVEIEIGKIRLPKFPVPMGYTADTYLSQLTSQSLFDMALSRDINIEQYQARLIEELEVIQSKGFSDYFLIVWDYIKFARDNGILVGPGRGSSGGSIVAYLLRITNIDPIKYDLLFERFLDPSRSDMPDIDSDFSYLRRHEVVEYIANKYGHDRVAQIGTFGTLSTKAAFKDIGRGLGIDHNIINDMNKLIPTLFGHVYTIDEALEEVKELREYEIKYPKLFELARKVLELPRTNSIHACGLILSPEPIHNIIPLMLGKDGEVVTQYDGPTLADKLGMLKADLLGLKNLSVIDIARDLVKQVHGIDINPDNLEPDDPKVFELIRQGYTDSLFQIESDGMKKMFRGINKITFEDLVAGIAMYRPGPLKFIPEYQERANGYKEVEYPCPELEEVLKKSHGLMIYQEDIMKTAYVMAGYSKAEVNKLRKGIAKKDMKIVEEELGKLSDRIVAFGHPLELATKIVEIIRPFANYGFPRAHAVAYAILCYMTAYFKTYYPTEYMAGVLTVFGDKEDKVRNYIVDSKRMGISIFPPDINLSGLGFNMEGDKALRFGLYSIKGLGDAVIDHVLEARPFESLEDLIARVPKKNLNKKSLESLAFSGALDNLANDDNRQNIMFTIHKIRGDKKVDLTAEVAAFDHKAKLEKEKELLGLFISGHPLDGYAQPINWDYISNGSKFDAAGVITSFKELDTKKGDKMAFVNIETLEGSKRIVLFPDAYKTVEGQLDKDLIIKVSLLKKYDSFRDEISYIVNKITIPKRVNKDVLDRRVVHEIPEEYIPVEGSYHSDLNNFFKFLDQLEEA